MRISPNAPVSILLLALALALGAVACSDDGGDGGGSDVADTGNTDTADSGADTEIVECPDDPAPLDGDPCDCEGDDFEGRVGLCDRSCLCEFGFWSCTEECDTPDVLALELGDSPTVDEQTGNGDAVINPGEVWSITGSVRALNAPEEGADTNIRLTSDSIHVDVEDASDEADALGDEPVEFTLPFEVSDVAPGGTVTLTLEAYSGFASVEDEIEIEIVPAQIPVLEFDDIEVLDEFGSPAVRVEAGDAIIVSAVLRNTGAVAAEGVSVSGSPSSTTLTTPDDVAVGVLAAASGERTIELTMTVSDDPSELAPVVTLAATADNATTLTEDVTVTVYPPDSVEVLGHEWDTSGDDLVLVIDVQNTGRFDLPGLSWSRVNYASPPVPVEPPDPPHCAVPGDCPDGFTCTNQACVEDPLYESLDIGEPTGPASMLAGAEGEVRMTLEVTEDTPRFGRVLLRASSDARSHGPFPLELTLPPR